MSPTETKNLQSILTTAHHDYEKGLNKYSFFKVSNQELSEDLVQETFLKTWHYLVKGGKIETMRAFLYHALNNLIITEYRKRKATSLDALLENGFQPSVDAPDQLFNLLDGRAALTLIQHLPEKYRGVMRMRYIEHLSLGEMSRITGQTKNAMAVQVHRALKRIRILYDHPQSRLFH